MEYKTISIPIAGKSVPIEPLDLRDCLGDGWGTVLTNLQKPFQSTGNAAIDFRLKYCEGRWLYAIHYVYKKKWNPKHKLPRLQGFPKAFMEAMGDWLLAVINLCDELYSIHPLGHEQYSNPAEWFDGIAREVKKLHYKEAQGLDEVGITKTKDQALHALRGLISEMREERNPCSPKKEIHSWRFFQAALEIIKTNNYPKLQRDLWYGRRNAKHKGLRDALTGYASLLEHPNARISKVEGDRLLIHRGRGNSWVNEQPVYQSPSSKPSQGIGFKP